MQVLNIFAMVFGLCGLTAGGIAILLATRCWAKVEGLMNSTHQVQYIPIDEQGKVGKDLDKSMEQALSHEYNGERDFM